VSNCLHSGTDVGSCYSDQYKNELKRPVSWALHEREHGTVSKCLITDVREGLEGGSMDSQFPQEDLLNEL
jgi:hypothetical protein